MQFDRIDRKTRQEWCWDYSYRFPSIRHQELEVSTIIAIDPWLEQDELEYMLQALESTVIEHSNPISFLLLLGTTVALLDVSTSDPELIYITQDVDPQ